jgi:hypothetical protein
MLNLPKPAPDDNFYWEWDWEVFYPKIENQSYFGPAFQSMHDAGITITAHKLYGGMPFVPAY